jgi:hypothetical protein
VKYKIALSSIIISIILLSFIFIINRNNGIEFKIKDQDYLVPWSFDPVVVRGNNPEFIAVIIWLDKYSKNKPKFMIEYARSNNDLYEKYSIPYVHGLSPRELNQYYSSINKIKFDDNYIFCKKTKNNINLPYDCSIWLMDGNVGFTVRFSLKDVPKVSMIKQDAIRLLNNFRKNADASSNR